MFGPGQIERIGKLAKDYGRKAIIVTGRTSARKSGLLARVEGLLSEAGVEFVVFDKIEPNPIYPTIDEGGELAKKEGCDLVIALGGGSALDAGKGIAVKAVNEGSVWKYVLSGDPDDTIPKKALPIIAVPTTAGTGSEADHFAVISNPETKEKPSMAAPVIFPKVAIVDPELMLTVPPRTTAATGLDVLCHSLEGYVSKYANPITDLFNLEVFSLVSTYLPRAYADGKDLEAREKMAWASTYAGISEANTGVALLHAMEHPISGYLDVAHGEGLAALLPAYVRYSYPGNPDKFDRVAKILGSEGRGLEACVQAFQNFLKKIDLDLTLSQLGVTEKLIPSLTKDVFKYMAFGPKANPVVPSEEDVAEIYKQSL
jgi:alcohol dehydrogenase class IV